MEPELDPDQRKTGSGDFSGEGSAEEGWEGMDVDMDRDREAGERSRCGLGFCCLGFLALLLVGSLAALTPAAAEEEEEEEGEGSSPSRGVRMSESAVLLEGILIFAPRPRPNPFGTSSSCVVRLVLGPGSWGLSRELRREERVRLCVGCGLSLVVILDVDSKRRRKRRKKVEGGGARQVPTPRGLHCHCQGHDEGARKAERDSDRVG